MKNTKLIVFVSALLCAVMALSSCTGSAALPNNDVLANDPIHENVIVPTESEDTGAENTPTIDNETASAKLAVWQKYLGYNKVVNNPAVANKTATLNTEDYSTRWSNNYGVVVMETSDWEYDWESEITTRTDTYSYKVYNIYEDTDTILVHDNKIVSSTATDDILSMRYTTVLNYVEDLSFYGLFCACYTKYKPVYEELPEGSTETPDVLEYVVDKTYYEFYLKDGTSIGTVDSVYDYGMETTAETNTFFVNGWGYIVDNDGNFITKVAEELYVEDPFVDATLDSNAMYKVGNYYIAKYEHYDYDIHSWVYNYKYFDLDGKPVRDYTIDEYEEYIFLPNGNILTQNFVELYDGVTEYDVYDYEEGIKYDVVTEIFDVASGKTSAVEFGYIITDYYDALENGTTVITDSLVVEGYSFENQMLASELTYLALNSDLTVKETLPEIIPNQTGLIQVSDADTVLIPATMNGYNDFFYRVTDGNFFAYDYKIYSATVSGILVVRDEDEDGNAVYDVIDYSGKLIVDNCTRADRFMKNEDGKYVSVIVERYDKEEDYRYVDLCYYDATNDTVVKKNIFSGDTEDYNFGNIYTYPDARIIRTIVYDYEDNEYTVKFINSKGEAVYTMYADNYSGSTFYRYFDDYSTTTSVYTRNDRIVIEYTKTGSEEDCKSYTIIK